MKKKFLTVLIVCFVMNALYVPTLFANDMELEAEEDITVLLHDDHTWDYKSLAAPKLSEDVSITLNNGDAVLVKTNHIWYYIEETSSSTSDERSYIGSVYSAGTAQGSDHFDTKITAINRATEHLAKQLISATGDPNLTIKRLSHCIEQEDKEMKIQEHVSKDIWNVRVNMSLDEDQIQIILDCAKIDME